MITPRDVVCRRAVQPIDTTAPVSPGAREEWDARRKRQTRHCQNQRDDAGTHSVPRRQADASEDDVGTAGGCDVEREARKNQDEPVQHERKPDSRSVVERHVSGFYPLRTPSARSSTRIRSSMSVAKKISASGPVDRRLGHQCDPRKLAQHGNVVRMTEKTIGTAHRASGRRRHEDAKRPARSERRDCPVLERLGEREHHAAADHEGRQSAAANSALDDRNEEAQRIRNLHDRVDITVRLDCARRPERPVVTLRSSRLEHHRDECDREQDEGEHQAARRSPAYRIVWWSQRGAHLAPIAATRTARGDPTSDRSARLNRHLLANS